MRWLFALLLIAEMLGCRTPTQVFVHVAVEPESLEASRELCIRSGPVNGAWTNSSCVEIAQIPGSNEPGEFSTRVPLYAGSTDRDRSFRFQAELQNAAGQVRNERSILARFVPSEQYDVLVGLRDVCLDVVCSDVDQTCVDGECVDVSFVGAPVSFLSDAQEGLETSLFRWEHPRPAPWGYQGMCITSQDGEPTLSYRVGIHSQVWRSDAEWMSPEFDFGGGNITDIECWSDGRAALVLDRGSVAEFDPSAETWVEATDVGPWTRELWGSSGDDIWVVGENGGSQALVHRKTMGMWQPVTVPPAQADASATAVWGRGPDEVYIGFGDGSVLRFDGATFESIGPSCSASSCAVTSISGNADVVVVSRDDALFELASGGSFVAVPDVASPSTVALAPEGSGVSATGFSRAAFRDPNGRWVTEVERPPFDGALPTDAEVRGDRALVTVPFGFFEWDGSGWGSRAVRVVSSDLNAASWHPTDPNGAVAVGANATVLMRTGQTSWHRRPVLGPDGSLGATLHDVAYLSSGTVVAVGDGGLILESGEDGQFRAVSTGTESHLRSLVGGEGAVGGEDAVGGEGAVAVGDDGVALVRTEDGWRMADALDPMVNLTSVVRVGGTVLIGDDRGCVRVLDDRGRAPMCPVAGPDATRVERLRADGESTESFLVSTTTTRPRPDGSEIIEPNLFRVRLAEPATFEPIVFGNTANVRPIRDMWVDDGSDSATLTLVTRLGQRSTLFIETNPGEFASWGPVTQFHYLRGLAVSPTGRVLGVGSRGAILGFEL
ncbi:MAG: hypothetical protein AAGF12_00040 [Myxococcota bacterium]